MICDRKWVKEGKTFVLHCKFQKRTLYWHWEDHLNVAMPEIDNSSLFFRRRRWHPTPVLLPGKSRGLRSLEGCSPWSCTQSDMTEQLHFHFSLSCIGEGNGNPLQCSCLDNPRDGGACWAAIYGAAQSRTRLRQLSSSSSPLYVKSQAFCEHYPT